MKRLTWAAPVVALVALGAAAATASAGISGPCSASLAGVNVAHNGTGATSTPIKVGHDAVVPILMQAQGRLSHVKVVLSFAGLSWTVKDKPATTPTYTDTVPVKDYATYGVGLYKVSGQGVGAGFSCSGSALVKVAGNPLTSVAGIAALVVTILAAVGLAFGFLGATGGLRPFRVGGSLVAGLLAAVGVLVLLQETAVLYPTGLVAIVGLVLGGAVGVVAPILGKLLGHGAGHAIGASGSMAPSH